MPSCRPRSPAVPNFMKTSALLLALILTLGTYAHAAPRVPDKPLTGVSMNAAKRLDARMPADGPKLAVSRSGVPMAVAARHGVPTQSERASSPDRALSGIPMALAKQL